MQPAVSTVKSVRLDVYVEDNQGSVYDLEVQTTNKRNLGKRSRYYQSVMDVRLIEKGIDYKKLKKSFVIFICNYDPYNASQYVYTFTTQCIEAPDVNFGDETTKIIINTKGSVGDISNELKAVINYMDSGIVTDSYTEFLDAEVRSAKSDEKVRVGYMMMQEALTLSEDFGSNKKSVKLIRGNMNQFSVVDLAKLLFVSVSNCQSVIDTINAHPDWDDGQVAEEIYWDE